MRYRIFLLGVVILASGFSVNNIEAKARGYVGQRELAQKLINAMAKKNFSAAQKLVPTRAEFATYGKKYSKKQYAEYLEKRKKGFKKLVAKFIKICKKRKNRGVGCAKYELGTITLNWPTKKGYGIQYRSMDINAKCAGSTSGDYFWIAKPKGIFFTGKAWKLTTFH